jgi:hypothetical protein
MAPIQWYRLVPHYNTDVLAQGHLPGMAKPRFDTRLLNPYTNTLGASGRLGAAIAAPLFCRLRERNLKYAICNLQLTEYVRLA